MGVSCIVVAEGLFVLWLENVSLLISDYDSGPVFFCFIGLFLTNMIYQPKLIIQSIVDKDI